MPTDFGLEGPTCQLRMDYVQPVFPRELVLLLMRHCLQLQMREVSIGVLSHDCATALHSKPSCTSIRPTCNTRDFSGSGIADEQTLPCPLTSLPNAATCNACACQTLVTVAPLVPLAPCRRL